MCDVMMYRMTQPLFLGGLIRFFSPGSDTSRSTAFVYAVCIFVCSFVTVVVKQAYSLAMFHIGMKMRVAVCSLVYRKASMGCSVTCLIIVLRLLQ
jgi:ATP-binding cassette subfamily C (CFTR/MRP) protein 4